MYPKPYTRYAEASVIPHIHIFSSINKIQIVWVRWVDAKLSTLFFNDAKD